MAPSPSLTPPNPQYEYLWADGVRVRTPQKLCAPDYINALFDWVEEQVGGSVGGRVGGWGRGASGCSASARVLLQGVGSCSHSALLPVALPNPLPPALPPPQLDNPALFPQRYGAEFPRDFQATVRNMVSEPGLPGVGTGGWAVIERGSLAGMWWDCTPSVAWIITCLTSIV